MSTPVGYKLTPAEMKVFLQTGKVPDTAKPVAAEDLPPDMVAKIIAASEQSQQSPIQAAMDGTATIVDHKNESPLDPLKVAEWAAQAELRLSDRDRQMIKIVWFAASSLVYAAVLGNNTVSRPDLGAALRWSLDTLAGVWRCGFLQALIDFAAGRLPALVLDRDNLKASAEILKTVAETQLQSDDFSQHKIAEAAAGCMAAQLIAGGGLTPDRLSAVVDSNPALWPGLNTAGQQIFMVGYASALAYVLEGRIKV
jgi:hypothetical protein